MGYLNSDDILDITQFIHSPPSIDSVLFAYDQSKFQGGQALKGTPAWDELIKGLPDIGHTGILFGKIPDLPISQSETPQTYALLGKIKDDYKLITEKGKNYFKRISPYQYYNFLSSDTIAPEAKNSASYPSGHGNYITASALILICLFPEKANEIMQKAYNACNMIVSVGFHWHTDVETGKFLGGVLFNQLLNNTEFQADLAACKAEVSQLV